MKDDRALLPSGALPEALLSRPRRWLVAFVLALAAVGVAAPPASPREAGLAGASRRGPGAALVARVERLERATVADPAQARDDADALLAELRVRRSDPEDHVAADALDTVALRVIAARDRAIHALVPPGEDRKGDFLRAVSDGAVASDWSWGVPASITLAQAILESDWGRSAPGNNLFGMKGEGPAGHLVRRVVEYRRGRRGHRLDPFRAYEDLAQSVADHGELLGEGRRYARARAAGEDLEAWAKALTGTYATDPRYAGKLLTLIDQRGLRRFDWIAPAPWR